MRTRDRKILVLAHHVSIVDHPTPILLLTFTLTANGHHGKCLSSSNALALVCCIRDSPGVPEFLAVLAQSTSPPQAINNHFHMTGLHLKLENST